MAFSYPSSKPSIPRIIYSVRAGATMILLIIAIGNFYRCDVAPLVCTLANVASKNAVCPLLTLRNFSVGSLRNPREPP